MGIDGHGVSLKIPDCTDIEKRLGGTLAPSKAKVPLVFAPI
jgi:hypothetical protein